MNDRTRERLLDLLAARATGDLAPNDERELNELLAAHPDIDVDAFELAAAAIDVAVTDDSKPMPAALRQRIESKAATYVRPADKTARRPRRQRGGFPALAWTAAAIFFVVGAIGWWQVFKTDTAVFTVDDATRIEAASDAVVASLTATEDPAATGASGQIVWSPSLQRGFIKVSGLAVNDRTQSQYQLWMFDAGRDDRYPIDGGVFDIPSRTGDVYIEIDARLAVTNPQLFAITVEQPGGVVVSDRGRIVLLGDPTQSGG